MISRRELRKQAMRQGVALGALEKDYVLALILERLYSDPAWREALVFKGGTALNKVYKTPRLSLDLDFTARQPVSVDALLEDVFQQLRALFETKLPETL